MVDDCFEGTRKIKSPENREKYLHKFPSEQSGGGFQYELRCLYADYDNIFRSAIDLMTGIMGKTPAAVRFDIDGEEFTPQEVKDIDVWGNKYDDRLTGLKARLNHAQTLFGRYGLLLDVETNKQGLEPRFIIKEYCCYSILDGEMYQSPMDGKDRLKWIMLDESSSVFNPVTKTREQNKRYRILGVDAANRYYSAVLEGGDADVQWLTFNLDTPAGAVYPQFKGTFLSFVPFTICNVDRLGIDEWQSPPFIDMAYSTINAYNADSVHKLALTNHARPTLVTMNAKSVNRLVLGGLLELQSQGNNPASAVILETSGAGLNALSASVAKIKEDALRRTIQGMLDAAGANSSGEALALRTAAGTATIAAIDLAGARAVEEQLCFAAFWAGLTWRESGERISYSVDTSYINKSGTIAEFVGLMGANIGADGKPLLSRRNLFAIVSASYPNIVSSWDDNELQLESEGMTSQPFRFSEGIFNDDKTNTNEADNAESGEVAA